MSSLPLPSSILFTLELKDLIHSYKSILLITVAGFYPYIYNFIKADTLPPFIYHIFILAASCQFVYDSLHTDKQSGSMSLYINIGLTYKEYISSKLIMGLIITLMTFILGFPYIIQNNDYYYLPIILLSSIYASLLMFMACVISKGEEIATAIVVLFILFILLVIIELVQFTILKYLFVIILDITLFYLDFYVYNSKYFRTQL